jgi:hypothetical protein
LFYLAIINGGWASGDHEEVGGWKRWLVVITWQSEMEDGTEGMRRCGVEKQLDILCGHQTWRMGQWDQKEVFFLALRSYLVIFSWPSETETGPAGDEEVWGGEGIWLFISGDQKERMCQWEEEVVREKGGYFVFTWQSEIEDGPVGIRRKCGRGGIGKLFYLAITDGGICQSGSGKDVGMEEIVGF